MNSHTQTDSNSANELVATWWLAIEEETVGPHSQAYIAQGLSDGSLDPLTPACRVNEQRWRPLRMWPLFADVVSTSSPEVVASSQHVPSTKPPLWNERLPIQARCIGLYCLFLQPAILGLSLLFDLATGGLLAETSDQMDRVIYPIYDYLLSIALAVLFVIAGRQLIALRRAAIFLVPTAIGISAVRFIAAVIAIVFALAYSITLPVDEYANSQPMTGSDAVLLAGICLFVPLSLAIFCFDIYSLSWWFQHGRQLDWIDADRDATAQPGENTNE